MNVKFSFPVTSRHHVFEMYISEIIRHKTITPENDVMVIKGIGTIGPCIRLLTLFDSIVMKIKAGDSVAFEYISTALDNMNACIGQLADSYDPLTIQDLDNLIIGLLDENNIRYFDRRRVQPHLEVAVIKDKDAVTKFAIRSSEIISARSNIDITRTDDISSGFKIKSDDAVETDIEINQTFNPITLYLRGEDGLVIGSVITTISDLNECMMKIADMWRPLTIGELDGLITSVVDQMHMPNEGVLELNPHLEVAIIKDKEASSKLVLRTAESMAATSVIDIATASGITSDFKLRTYNDATTFGKINVSADPLTVYVRANGGISVGPINMTVEELNACMSQLIDMWEPITAEELNGAVDEAVNNVSGGRGSLGVHLEFAIIKDEDAAAKLVLRAVDNTGTKSQEVLEIGYMDELDLDTLDVIQNAGYKPISLKL